MEKRPFQRDEKLPCNSCKRDTWHWIVWSDIELEERITSIEELNEPIESEDNSLPKEPEYNSKSIRYYHERIECCGCGSRRNRDYKTHSSNNEKYDVIISSPSYELWYKEPLAQLLENLPSDVARAYIEAIATYNSGNHLSSATMILHTLEGMGSEVKVDLQNAGENPLNIKLDQISKGLIEKKLITEKLSEIILGLAFLGNKSKHALKDWGRDHLDIAIMIMEHILQNMVIERIYENKLEKLVKPGRRA